MKSREPANRFEEDFQQGRDQWRSLLTGAPDRELTPQSAMLIEALDEKARLYLRDIRTGSEEESVRGESGEAQDPKSGHITIDRLASLAIAYRTRGSQFYLDAKLLGLLLARFRRFKVDFPTDREATGNWWFWEVGIPKHLVNLGALLRSDMTEGDLQYIDAFLSTHIPDPNVRTANPAEKESGANRSDKAHIVVVHGLVSERAERITQGIECISDVAGLGARTLFRYVERGDGFYADGSFIQHNRLAQAGSYGIVALSSVSSTFATLAGTVWQMNTPDVKVLLDSIELTFSPFVFGAAVMDAVRGRAVSREEESDHVAGGQLAGDVLVLAESFPSYRARFRSLVKSWLLARVDLAKDSHLRSVFQSQLAADLLADEQVPAADALQGHFHMPDQLRVVHHKGSWAVSFSLSSNRIGRYSWGNGENNSGWYQGDGLMQLRVETDPQAFSVDYWATSDPYHLPGVTNGLEQRDPAPSNRTVIPQASQEWAGGVGWLGKVGAIGLDHRAYDGDLCAFKSWFALEDAVVCLGSGITATQGQRVHTTIESRKLQSATQRILVDGRGYSEHQDGTTSPDTIGWAHIEGVGGYLFLGTPSIKISKESRTSTWRAINESGSGLEKTDEYFNVIIDHGVNPSSRDYQYAVLPTAMEGSTAERASDPRFSVIANSPSLQAIKVADRNLVMANFFAPGKVAGIAANVRASVIIGEDAQGPIGTKDQVVTVSAPPRHDKVVGIVVSRMPGTMIEFPEHSEFTDNGASYRIAVATQGSRGHGFHWRFTHDPVLVVSHRITGEGLLHWRFDGPDWETGEVAVNGTSESATAELPFRGSAIGIQSICGPDGGVMEVSIDGDPPRLVDTYKPASDGVRIVAMIGGLAPDQTHSLKISVLDAGEPGSSERRVRIAGVVIRP